MGRHLGIDIGSVRTGIAISDVLNIIATPFYTIPSETLLENLEVWIPQYQIDTLVIGNPLSLSGGDSDNSRLVRETLSRISKKWPDVNLVLIDERYTSKLASRSLVQSGMKKSRRRRKGELDKVSAAMILQDYLNS